MYIHAYMREDRLYERLSLNFRVSTHFQLENDI